MDFFSKTKIALLIRWVLPVCSLKTAILPTLRSIYLFLEIIYKYLQKIKMTHFTLLANAHEDEKRKILRGKYLRNHIYLPEISMS
jgi:hypothetical protein